MSEQLENWRVCQVCGRAIASDRAVADGWLVSPYRFNPDLLVVRCFRHWSEWALRASKRGRTKNSRKMMEEGRARAAAELHPIPAVYEPFPLGDKPL